MAWAWYEPAASRRQYETYEAPATSRRQHEAYGAPASSRRQYETDEVPRSSRRVYEEADTRDRARYRPESRYYPRDRSEERYETAVPERPSLASYGGTLGGRSSLAISEATPRARSPFYQDGPSDPPQESRFLALELSAARRAGATPQELDRIVQSTYQTQNRPTSSMYQTEERRPTGSMFQTQDRPTGSIFQTEGRPSVSTATSRSRTPVIVDDQADRRAGSRFVVEDVPDRRAGSRFIVEEAPDRCAGSRFVVEEPPERRQGSRYVHDEPSERVPYYDPYARVFDDERKVQQPRRMSSMERLAPAERDRTDRTSPRRQYVVMTDRDGGYMGLDRR